MEQFQNTSQNTTVEYRIPTPKTNYEKPTAKIPTSMLIAHDINGVTSMRLLRVLFDSGSDATMIHRGSLPRSCQPYSLTETIRSNTTAGTFNTDSWVSLNDVVLPEFDRNKHIPHHHALVFDGNVRYDLILGRDFLNKIGIRLHHDTDEMEWLGTKVEMKSHTQMSNTHFLYSFMYEEYEEDDILDCFTAQILDAKYEKVNTDQLAEKQIHLTPRQRLALKHLFRKYDKLFDGTLGVYSKHKISLEVDPNATPIHARPYSVARAHEDTFKRELQHLVKIGVLRPCGATEWACPTFIVPKKDGRVRWVSDFRALNKVLRRRVYPLPRIQEILTKRTGYKFFTKLDISMQYYTFELDDEAKELCTIVTPYGKFQYCRLPMGIKCAPDIAQEIMEEILHDLVDCDVFIDDIGAFSQDWENHLILLEKILDRMQDNGFTINPLKCEWAVQETDWLGYWLTPKGLKPWKKKIDAIIKMDRPRNIKQLRSFIGAVNFYRDLWPRRAHVLQPLTDLTGKGSWQWTDIHERAFQEMKALIASDALMHYPDHNQPFEIYTDASDYQVGACIMQQGHPVAYYSRKLTPTQQRYSTMEKELLSIVLTFSEFRSILLGSKLTVYTDHKNLTYSTLNNSRVLRWRLFLEEYDATYLYLKGKHNVLADAFSRLPRMENLGGKNQDQSIVDLLFLTLDAELLDCFLNLPAPDHIRNPMNMQWLQQNQFEDFQLLQQREQHPQQFPVKYMEGVPVICYQQNPQLEANEWKICIPTGLLDDMIKWFHLVLGHGGKTRVYDSIRRAFHHPLLKHRVDTLQCSTCQQHKLPGTPYGELPPREAILMPWEEVHVDLIGPWTLQVGNAEVEFSALTCIDPVTNLTEIVRIDNKSAEHIANKFEDTWLSRYPWPTKCVHDNGGEFIGWEFQRLLEQCNIRDRPTTSRNPQANAICERMHLTVGNILRALSQGNHLQHYEDATMMVDRALATTMHVL